MAFLNEEEVIAEKPIAVDPASSGPVRSSGLLKAPTVEERGFSTLNY